jgi:hypothetical protein
MRYTFFLQSGISYTICAQCIFSAVQADGCLSVSRKLVGAWGCAQVESHQRGLSECRMKLQTSLESNERISRYSDFTVFCTIENWGIEIVIILRDLS